MTDSPSLANPRPAGGDRAPAADARDAPALPRLVACPDGGQLLALDVAAVGGDAIADVVLVPPFGKTVQDLLAPTVYLRENGFNVLRFDARHHLGRSSGDIIDFRLSSLARDLELVLAARAGARPVVLVGTSLSAPIVFKRAARAADVLGVVSLVGVVDVAETIVRAAGMAIEDYRAGGRPPDPRPEVMGFRVRGVEFVADMDAHGYGSFETTCADAAAIAGPVRLVAAAQDELVDIAKVRRLASGLGPGARLTVLEHCSHELSRSFVVARQALEALVAECFAICPPADGCAPLIPPLTTLIEASAAEAQLLADFDALGRELAA